MDNIRSYRGITVRLVCDYYSTDEDYGTMCDFELFIAEAHKRSIRVIADMVFNHTSTEHEWFKESRKSQNNPYRDYYIWRDKPNNWESFFSGSAWEYEDMSHQYYYHKFAKEQADLNWATPSSYGGMQKNIEVLVGQRSGWFQV